MKNIILLLIATELSFSSCQKECSTGFEGKYCKTELRQKYYGTYKGTIATGNTFQQSNVQVLTASSNETEIIIGGMKAVLNNNQGKFYFPTQQLIYSNGAAYNAYGNGYFDNEKLDYNITTERNGTYQTYVFTGLKSE